MSAQPIYPLRHDIDIMEHEPAQNGQPCWLLYDPVRHQYFHLAWMEFEVLSRLELGDIQVIHRDLCEKTTLAITIEQLGDIIQFFEKLGILSVPEDKNQGSHQDPSEANAPINILSLNALKNSFMLFLSKYYFFKIPLFNPTRMNDFLYQKMRHLSWKISLITLGVWTFILLYYVMKYQAELPLFNHDLAHPLYLLWLVPLMVISKLLHEMGHSMACRFYRVPVREIGAAFIFLWPVLYTDTHHSWRLSHKKRAIVGIAGIFAELIIANLALTCWFVFPDGVMRDICFFFAFVSWGLSVAININPFLKFDGYYVLSDFVNMPNLFHRAFLYLQNRLTFFLYKIDIFDARIHHQTSRMRCFLMIYAMGNIVFRFFLYAGILWMIYMFFYKPIAIIVIITSVILFFIKPVVSFFMKHNEQQNYLYKARFCVMIIALLAVFHLLGRTETIPAQLTFVQSETVYARGIGQITQMVTHQGLKKDIYHVKKGDILTKQKNDKLSMELKKCRIELERLENIWEKYGQLQLNWEQDDISEKSIHKQRQMCEAHASKIDEMTMNAAFDGVFVPRRHLSSKPWVRQNKVIGKLYKPEKKHIVTYITLGQKQLLDKNSDKNIYFITNAMPHKRWHVLISDIAIAPSKELEYPALSMVHHGVIPMTRDKQTNEMLIRGQYYKMTLLIHPDDRADFDEIHHAIDMEMMGSIHYHQSFGEQCRRLVQSITQFFIAESGL